MKSPFRLPAFLLTAFLLAYTCLLGNARTGASLYPPSASDAEQPPTETSTSLLDITIPGPLRSFLRMAAISQKISANEVLSLLARNVTMEGYGWHGKTPQPTEYLILLKGYLEHARELLALAGPKHIIRVSTCSEAQPLLKVLGYKLRQPCGNPDISLETADPKKAFLTIDSGFPLTDLEDALRGGKPFVYPFPTSQVPVLFKPNDWILKVSERTKGRSKKNEPNDVIDSLVNNPQLARLYWALARMDANTRAYLEQSPGLEKLIPYAAVLDFYGSNIRIRSGRVVVPGGAVAEPAWKSLVGASPESPKSFITHLLEKDEGWMAAYFDALSRIDETRQAYFTEPHRLHLFYKALRGENPSPSPAKPVFRPNPGLLLLVTRIQLEPSGQPHIPGNLDAWAEVLVSQRKSKSKIARMWAKQGGSWKTPDQLVAAMFAFSRVNSENNPLQLFLMLTEIDRRRAPQPGLSPKTVRLLAEKFQQFGDQYPIFSEFSALNDSSIARFLNVANSIDHIHDLALRSDASGIFQADMGLWEILARQGQIPTANWNRSWQRIIHPFGRIHSSAQLFDTARNSLGELIRAASGTPHVSQDKIISLLAGPDQTGPESQRVKQELAYRISSALEAQRLVSLDTLFSLGDDLNRMAQGKPMPQGMIQLAGELREFQLPKPLFTGSERAEWSYGLYSNSHIQSELATDLAKIIRSPHSAKELTTARGQLVPFLRDTLVGLNYAYYQPPGAQVLYNDTLFVRSHDFSGQAITGRDQEWRTPIIFGRGWTAGGGVHLVGSLADLPYVLAEVEQDFIVPENVQALIWGDLVPTLLTNSVVPRWWRVTPNELHAVALYQRFGEELVTAATKDERLRQQVIDILAERMLPQRYEQIEQALQSGRQEEALSQLAPIDTFYLAANFRRKFPNEAARWGKAGEELQKLSERYPNEVSWERLSEDFGVPHPALADTYACELLDVKPFPTFLGFSSRLLAESWESNNLYWARLADEMGYQPVMLNLLVPELTRHMIAKIFATDLEDRPALLRALWETGKAFRNSHLASVPEKRATSGL